MSTINVQSFSTFDDTYRYNIPTSSIAKGKVLAWANWTNTTTGLVPTLQNSYNVQSITNVARGRNQLNFQTSLPTLYSGRGISYDNATSTPSAVFLDRAASGASSAQIVEVDLGTTFTLEGRSSQTSVVLIGG